MSINTSVPMLPPDYANSTYLGSNLSQFSGDVNPQQILTNAFSDYLYHRRYVQGGALVADEFRFFHLGIGENDVFINNAAALYATLECDVNLEGGGGQLIAGMAFWIAAIEFELVVPNHAFTTPFAGVNTTAIVPLPDAAAELAGDNLVIAYRENTLFTMYNDRSKKMESGTIACFPAAGGQFGYTGTADGIAQNGGLSNRGLSALRNLTSLQNFYGIWEVCRPITIPTGLTHTVQPKLVGLGLMAS